MCGKSYEQVVVGATADYLQQTAEPCETIRERHRRRQAIIARLQNAAVAFI